MLDGVLLKVELCIDRFVYCFVFTCVKSILNVLPNYIFYDTLSTLNWFIRAKNHMRYLPSKPFEECKFEQVLTLQIFNVVKSLALYPSDITWVNQLTFFEFFYRPQRR